MSDLIERLQIAINAGSRVSEDALAEIERLTADCSDWAYKAGVKKGKRMRLTAELKDKQEIADKYEDRYFAMKSRVKALEGALNRIANGHGLQRDIGIAVNALAATEHGESDESR